MTKSQTSKTKTIEESLDELEDIVSQLEDDDTPLEDSFKIYEQGMKMARAINARIDKVEKKLIVLDQSNSEDDEDTSED